MDTLKAHLPIIFFFVLSLTPIQITTMTPRNHFQMARSMCHGAFHPDLCISTLASFPGLASKSLPEIIIATLNRSAEEVRAASAHSTVVKKNLLTRLSMIEQALDICLELFQDILNDIANAVGYLEGSNSAARRHYFDLESLLSGVMANLYTCTDEFDPCTDNLKLGDSMKERLLKRLTPRRLSMRG